MSRAPCAQAGQTDGHASPPLARRRFAGERHCDDTESCTSSAEGARVIAVVESPTDRLRPTRQLHAAREQPRRRHAIKALQEPFQRRPYAAMAAKRRRRNTTPSDTARAMLYLAALPEARLRSSECAKGPSTTSVAGEEMREAHGREHE